MFGPKKTIVENQISSSHVELDLVEIFKFWELRDLSRIPKLI